MFCRNCGLPIPEGADRCASCGTPTSELQLKMEKEEQASAVQKEQAQPETPGADAQPQADMTAKMPQTPEKPQINAAAKTPGSDVKPQANIAPQMSGNQPRPMNAQGGLQGNLPGNTPGQTPGAGMQRPMNAQAGMQGNNMQGNLQNGLQGGLQGNLPGNMPGQRPGMGMQPRPMNMQGMQGNNMQGNLPGNMPGQRPGMGMQGNMPGNMPGGMPGQRPGAAMQPQVKLKKKFNVLAFLASLMLAGGTFLPFLHISFFGQDAWVNLLGFNNIQVPRGNGMHDGYILLGIAAVSFIFCFVKLDIIQILAGGGAIGVVVYDLIKNTGKDSVGWKPWFGAWILLAAGAMMLLGGIIWFVVNLKRRKPA